jgi:hypothetical protein
VLGRGAVNLHQVVFEFAQRLLEQPVHVAGFLADVALDLHYLVGDELLHQRQFFRPRDYLVGPIRELRRSGQVELSVFLAVVVRRPRVLPRLASPRFSAVGGGDALVARHLQHALVLDALGVKQFLAIRTLVHVRQEYVDFLVAEGAQIVFWQPLDLPEHVSGYGKGRGVFFAT